MTTTNKSYGIELILDLHYCGVEKMTKDCLSEYFIEVCDLISMTRHGEPMFWHDKTDDPNLKGVSGVQFIETSNIVVHALELKKAVYINIFSCKLFDTSTAENFSKNFFGAEKVDARVLKRN